MNIIYNKNTGEIDRAISDDQDYKMYYRLFPKEFKDNLACIKVIKCPKKLKHYRVINGEIFKKSDKEIQEIILYGRVLTEEERLNIKLQPNPEEVKKAKNTIETLATLQEVGII